MRISDWSSDVCSSDLLGQEVEPPEIDREVEARDVELLFVGVEQLDFLGAGEQAVGRGRDGPRRHRLRLAQVVRLVDIQIAALAGAEAGVQVLRDRKSTRLNSSH